MTYSTYNPMNNQQKEIPRTIWLLWFQGLENAPLIVQKCVVSWITKNPNWDVIVLDKHSLKKYIDYSDESFPNLGLAGKSDLIRLSLLAEYGGVWVDATTFCVKPLDSWINEASSSGFFAFEKPGPDRLIASWFLASEVKSPLVILLKNELYAFWLENNYSLNSESKRKRIKILSKYFNRSYKTTKYWFSPLVTKLLKVYPYFVIHYKFARLISRDLECKKIWDNTKKISASPSLLIKRQNIFQPASEIIKNEIDNEIVPVYKLIWNYDQSKYQSSSLVYYLLENKN